MKNIRWIKISVTALLAAQSACSYEDKPQTATSSLAQEQSPETQAYVAPMTTQKQVKKFVELDLKKLPKDVQGRMRCMCQNGTGPQ